jgi:hypothetical protein
MPSAVGLAGGALDKSIELGCCLTGCFRQTAAVMAAQSDGRKTVANKPWPMTGHDNGQQNVWGNVRLVGSNQAEIQENHVAPRA